MGKRVDIDSLTLYTDRRLNEETCLSFFHVVPDEPLI
jgi:hypothetical protein